LSVSTSRPLRVARCVLAAGEGPSVSVTPNKHMPLHLRDPVVRVREDWLYARTRAGHPPLLETDVAIRDDAALEFWHPLRPVHVEIVGDDGLTGFESRAEFTWDDWRRAQRALNTGPTTLRVRVPLQAPVRSRQEEAARVGEVDYYRDGYFFRNQSRQYSRSLPQTPPLRRAYRQGTYDAAHFYPFGTSFPVLSRTTKERYRSLADPKLSRNDYTAEALRAVPDYAFTVYPTVERLLMETLRTLDAPHAVSPALLKHFNVEKNRRRFVQEIANSLARQVLVERKSLGVEGAVAFIRSWLEKAINASGYLPRTPQQQVDRWRRRRDRGRAYPPSYQGADWVGYFEDPNQSDPV
jgi:hypothetical protein